MGHINFTFCLVCSHKCKPDCKQRCEPHGDCVSPDVCQCHFGYVGHNCTTECQCNKHSNCKSVAERDICLDCQNNTQVRVKFTTYSFIYWKADIFKFDANLRSICLQGAQCEECKPLYVGNPASGGSCQSCKSFCHDHSEVCVSKEKYQIINNYNPYIDPNLQLRGQTSNGNVSISQHKLI